VARNAARSVNYTWVGRIALTIFFVVVQAACGSVRSDLPSEDASKSLIGEVGRGASSDLRQTSASHLYVSAGPKIYRYPIVSGVVATSPDAVLNVRDPQCGSCSLGVNAIAVDSAGNLYAAAQNGAPSGDYVLVYRLDSKGNASPIRVLNIINGGPWSVAVDPRGFLYVEVYVGTSNSVADVFKPGANGNASPVATITSVDRNGGPLVLGPQGNVLYVAPYGVIQKYTNIRTTPASAGSICNNAVGTALAIGTMKGKQWLYESRLSAGSHQKGTIVVWQGLQNRPCPSKPRLRILLSTAPKGRFDAFGIALDQASDALYASDGGAGKVYQFNALDFQPQAPIQTINLAGGALAVGI
jgi:hypothetical protein